MEKTFSLISFGLKTEIQYHQKIVGKHEIGGDFSVIISIDKHFFEQMTIIKKKAAIELTAQLPVISL